MGKMVGRSQISQNLQYDISLGFIVQKMYTYQRLLIQGIICLDPFLKKIASDNILKDEWRVNL